MNRLTLGLKKLAMFKGMLKLLSRVWWDRLLLILKILISTGLIVFLYNSGHLDIRDILDSYKNTGFLYAGVLCCTLALVTPIFRWWLLIRVQKLPLRGFDALRLTMIGYFFNIFIPSGSGGDVVRAAYAIRDCPERRAQALTIAFVDRGFGLHALLLLSVTVFFSQPDIFATHPSIQSYVLIIFGILLLGTIASFLIVWDRTNSFILRFLGRIIGGSDAWREAMMLYRQFPGMVAIAYLFSLGSAVFNVLAIHFMMLAVGAYPSIIESLLIVPLIIIVNTLPLTPGGIGLAEGASAGLYALVGVTGGANGMLLTRFFIILHALLGLPFFLANQNITLGERKRLI